MKCIIFMNLIAFKVNIIQVPQSDSYAVGSVLQLMCSTSPPKPNLKYDWRFNDQQIIANDEYEISKIGLSSNLYLKNVTRGGRYECKVSDEQRVSSNSVLIRVKGQFIHFSSL